MKAKTEAGLVNRSDTAGLAVENNHIDNLISVKHLCFDKPAGFLLNNDREPLTMVILLKGILSLRGCKHNLTGSVFAAFGTEITIRGYRFSPVPGKGCCRKHEREYNGYYPFHIGSLQKKNEENMNSTVLLFLGGEVKGIMENPYSQFGIFGIYYTGYLYLRGAYHHDVDTMIGQSLKHLCGNSGMGLHTNTYD